MFRPLLLAALFTAPALAAQATDGTLADAATAAAPETIVSENVAAAPNPEILRKGFTNLSEGARIYVQKVMANAGLYDSGIDGLYGPGTEAASIAIAGWIAEKSGGATRFDLSTAKGVTEMFAFLRGKGAEPWLE